MNNCQNGCGEMRIMNYKDSTIVVCPQCISIWLDEEALGCIVESNDGVWPPGVINQVMMGPPKLPRSNQHCPDCQQPLQAQEFFNNSQIVLNQCAEQHGVWLDPGDLARIQIVAQQNNAGIHACLQQDYQVA